MSLSNLLVTSQKIIGTWSWILEAFMGKLPCYVSLLTTLTPRCLISSFIVQKRCKENDSYFASARDEDYFGE